MGRNFLSLAKKRQSLVEQKAGSLVKAGSFSLREGHWGEALECLEAASHCLNLSYLTGQNLSSGNRLILCHVIEVLGQKSILQDLVCLKAWALTLGKFSFAQAIQAILEPSNIEKS